MRLLATIGALSCLIACAQPAPSALPALPKPDLATEARAIRDADARWLKMAQARDAAGTGAMFAADGIAVRQQGAEFTGPAAIQASAEKDYVENPKSQVTWTTDTLRVADSGDMAVQTGQVHTTAAGPKGDRETRERFVTVWRKINGEWKVAYDIATPIVTAPPKKGQ